MKEQDLILNMLANQDFTAADFYTAGFTAENTGLRPEEDYINSSKINTRPEFQDAEGNFDKAKFHNFYVAAGYFYNQLANQNHEQAILEQAQYSKDNMWVDPKQRTLDYKPKLVRLPNEHLVTNSLETIGKRGERKLSQSEIAQTQKVYNTETGEWTDSPNDSFFGNFFDTLVLATYDEDEYDEDGKLIHQKGERKLNEDDLPYYETLGGRSVYGKQVLSKFNTLTTDDSFANRFDFFDTDDIEEKSFLGVAMRNAALVGSMFIPGVGPWITGLSVAVQTAGILANLSKLVLGEDNETLNNIVGWTKSVNRQGQTEYAANNTWSMENIINMIGDSVGQLKEQRWVFTKAAPVLQGNTKALKVLQGGKKGQQHYDDIANKMAGELTEKGAAKTATDFLKDGAVTGRNLQEMAVAKSQFAALNKQKAINMLDDIINDATSFGGHLSMAYMTGLVVQDTYSEAIAAGASPTEAVFLTLGYAGAETILLNSNIGKWIIPEMGTNKFKREAIVNTIANKVKGSFKNAVTETEKKTVAQKLINFGKEIAEGEHARLVLSGSKALAQHATAESLEEVSEELLADFSKSTLNAVRWLRGEDPLNMGQWENMFDRYGMAALGGFVGGGIASAGTNFKAYRDISNMDGTQAMHELIYMVNNDQDEELIKSLDKMEIGNKHLSATKIIDYDAEGNAVYGEGTDKDNQDLFIKDFIKGQVKLVRDILTSEGAKISTTSLLNRLTLEDKEEFVKYHKYAGLQNSRAMNLYLEDFAEIQSKLVAAKAAVYNLEKNTPDVEKREDSYQERLKKANEEVEKQRIKLEAYTKGTIAPEAIRDAIYEMNPIFHNEYMKTNIKLFTIAKTGKKWEELSKEEQKDMLEKYKVYSETTMKNDIHTSAAILQNMMELYTPNVEAAKEFIQTLKEEGIAYQGLSQTIQQLTQSRPGEDTDDYLQKVQNFLNTIERNSANGIITPFISLDTTEKLFQILNEVVPEEVLNDPELLKQYNIDKELQLDNIIFGELLTNLDSVVQEFLNIGYIHPEVKKALIDTLNTLSSKRGNIIEQQYQEVFEHPELYPDVQAELDKITEESMKGDEAIEEYIKQIKELKNTPIIEFLNQFQLNTTESDLNITKHLDKVFKLFDEAKLQESIDELFLEEDFIDDNNEALTLVNSFISVIEGMKVDNADIINPTGYSKILNEVYQRQGIKNYVKLAELNSDDANMIIQDAALIRDRLNLIKRIHDINKGQKLKEHDVVAMNKNFLLYNQTQRLINILPEDWIGDDDKKSAKEVLQAKYDSLATLKGLTQDNLKLNKEQRRQANIEMITLEDAIYDIFQRNTNGNPEQLKDIILRFAGNNGFFQKTGDILNTATKFIDDNAYLWWLASRVALKSSDFYTAYSKAIEDDLAPIPSQELATYLGVAAIANMDIINAFTQAYHETVVSTFNNATEEDKKELLKQYNPNTEAFATDLLQYFASFDAVPQYSNMVFFEGIPGSGKSGGVYRAIKTIINYIDPSVLKGAIYAHTTEENAKDAAENIKLEDYVAMDKEKLMRYASSEWRDIKKNPANNKKNNTYYLYDDSYDFVDGKLVNKWAINKVSNAPRVMFIDEITHYNQQELSMLEQFAKENGIVLLLAGDLDQSKQRAYTTKAKYKGKDINVSISRNYFPRVPKLGLTLRTLNRQMNHDVLMMQDAINKRKDSNKSALYFTYLENDKEHQGLYGVKAVSSLNDEAKKTIDTIFSTATGKVGYVYHNEDTELYKYLMSNYADKIDKKHVNDAQGREGQYYIIEPDASVSDDEFIETLYTGVTRSEQGALVLSPSSKGNIEHIGSKEDPIFQLLSWREQLQKVSEQGKKELEEIAKHFKGQKIEIKKPTTTIPTTTPPLTPGTTPPVVVPPVVPPIATKVTKEEAMKELDEFDNKFFSLAEPAVVRISDKQDMGDVVTDVREDSEGNWIPYVEFKNSGEKVDFSDFYKEYEIIDKQNNKPVPVYHKGEKLTIDESGNVSNVIINQVDDTKNPIEYTISNIDGTNTRTILQPELQGVFKEYYKESEPDPESESEFLPDDDRAFDDPSELEAGITHENGTEQQKQQQGQRMLHKLYSFNAFEMGVRLENGKIVYDGEHFDKRKDNAIGLMHLMGLRPETSTAGDYKNLENTMAALLSYVENSDSNSKTLENFIRLLELPSNGNYNIVYAIKTTAGENQQSGTEQFYQGSSERLSHIHAKNEEAYVPKKQKIVLLLKNRKDTIFELTVGTLNSPLTRMQDTDENGNLLYQDVYDAYITAYNKYQTLDPLNPGRNQHLAINDVIDQFDNKFPNTAKQDLINLFKLYSFTSNGIFYLGSFQNGKFNNSFIYGKTEDYGVQLVKRRGDKQLNGRYQFGNPEQDIDTDEFIDLYEFAKNPRLRVSSLLSANQDMKDIHKNHAIVLVSTDLSHDNDDKLINAYLNGDKHVKRFYVLPPEATTMDWLEDQQNFFLNNQGQKKIVRGIGNTFTSYRILQRLVDSGEFEGITSSDNTSEQVKATVQKLNEIERKWNNEDIDFNDSEVLTNGQTDKQIYEYWKQVYKDYPEGEQWARRAARIIEQKHYLDSPNNWNAFKVKNEKTIGQALTSFLTKAVWKEQLDTATGKPITVKDDAMLKKLENATKGQRQFYKVRKSKNKLGPHGEFTRILTHNNSIDSKYTAFIDEKGKKFNYKINAKIDTPTRGAAILHQMISFITKTDSKKPWSSTTGNGNTHRTFNYYYNPLDQTWKLITDPSGSRKTYAQKCWEDYLGISPIFGGPQSISEIIKGQYESKYNWMDFSVLDATKSKKENLRLLAAKNQGNGRFVFEYNDRLYVLDNIPTGLENLPSYIENTNNEIIIKGTENGSEISYQVKFVQGTDGNISEVQATKTHYVRVSANGINNAFEGILETHFQDLKNAINEYNQGQKSVFLKIPSRLFSMPNLGALLSQLEVYSDDNPIINEKTIMPDILISEINKTLNQVQKKLEYGGKTEGIQLLKKVLNYVENLGNLENNNQLSEGEIIKIGDVKMQVIAQNGDVVTGTDLSNNTPITVNINEINYFKEETICSPEIWKMI